MAATKQNRSLEVLRERWVIEHQDAVTRTMRLEFEVMNRGNTVRDYIPIIVQNYLHGLEITDGSGARLAFLPTEEIERRIGRSTSELTSAFKKKFDRRGARAYEPCLLWVVLREPLKPQGVAVLVMRHTPEDEPAPSPGFVRRVWYDVQEFKDDDSYPTVVEIHAPSGWLIEAREDVKAKISRSRKSPRTAQWTVRKPKEKLLVKYRLNPLRGEVTLMTALFLFLCLAPIAVALSVWQLGMQLTYGSNSPGLLVSSAGTSLSLALASIIRPTVARRVWFLLPLALNLTLFVWTIADIASQPRNTPMLSE